MTTYNLAMLQRMETRDMIPMPPQPINPTMPDGRWRAWLAKPALWLLAFLGVRHEPPPAQVRHIEYTQFNEDDVFREIRLGQHEIQRIWNRDVKYILVGRDYWERIVRKAEESPFGITVGLRLAMNGGHPQVFGLRLVMLPWIQGYALLPELSEVR